ncbi:MAG: sigma-54-dependent Fis family transcriptional regulator [Bdellovibrionaceae bacterium]|nr:sigma-54-dependent Fis family transcriptional regulator [Pseudobdellovibrionaceae bacterium]
MSRLFVSRDPGVINILKLLENVASSKASILITGESGVGKEELSRWVHDFSPRRNKPFIAVNCAAIPGGLLESELFGFEKGSFTGAHQSKLGKIEMAQGGTFLLDEISELPLELQGKLLRVIQEREIERLGSKGKTTIDVRFICTTNKDLKAMVAQGTFRGDLFYRINVVPVYIPPLRERINDISYLAHLFLDQVCSENGFEKRTLTEDGLKKFIKWPWPGNVRELQNVIERSVLSTASLELGFAEILIDGFEDIKNGNTFGPGMTIHDAEKMLIIKTLEHTNQNRTHAAKLLGISIRTLRNKLNEYKLGKEISNESDI